MRAPPRGAGKLRVVVVDDSKICRAAIREVLTRDGDIDVVGEAADGTAAVELIERLRPDLATMDVEMPALNGLDVIEHLMARSPVPILVVTAQASGPGTTLAFEAIHRGALDIAPKPMIFRHDQGRELRERVRALARVPVVRRRRETRRLAGSPKAAEQKRPAPIVVAGSRRVVAIGASAGGPAAVAVLLSSLGSGFGAPIAVAQHIAADFTPSFASFLRSSTPFEVVVAEEPVIVSPGTVVLAPSDRHIVATGRSAFGPDDGHPVHGYRPSADVLFGSVATAHGARAVGVVLTGLGRDGAEGLLAMRRAGALTIAQDAASAAVDGMPRAAREAGAAEAVLSVPEMAALLCRTCGVRR